MGRRLAILWIGAAVLWLVVAGVVDFATGRGWLFRTVVDTGEFLPAPSGAARFLADRDVGKHEDVLGRVVLLYSHRCQDAQPVVPSVLLVEHIADKCVVLSYPVKTIKLVHGWGVRVPGATSLAALVSMVAAMLVFVFYSDLCRLFRWCRDG